MHKENMFDTRRKIKTRMNAFHAVNEASEVRLFFSLRASDYDDTTEEKHASRRFNDRDRRINNEPGDLDMTGAKNNQDSLGANKS
jgi:hypothetical protein